ncbi:hypothetical protein LCGC14_1316150 [marine sediment metagenome]|uniref:FCP1 homology domain-containing protein n=1 Tax=marine sediment metagenome TaxID=412755 RepID=A0A0F9L684_9ZZZZ
MMSIIFLDIDGVLNSFEKHADLNVPHSTWCPEVMNAFGIELEVFPEMIERINRVTDATGAKLIISSSWRVGYLADWADVIIHLHNVGLKGFIVGRTPWDKDGPELRTRGREIVAWFKQHPREKIDSFIILDDLDKMEPLMDHLIQTDHRIGMQDEHVERAIEMLNQPVNIYQIADHWYFERKTKDGN